MNPKLVADWADNLVARDSSNAHAVNTDTRLFKGKGNLCQQIFISADLAGLSHDEVHELARELFQLPRLLSLKELTIAQLKAIHRFRDSLGELYEATSQPVSGVHRN